jgi:hypothetical protein
VQPHGAPPDRRRPWVLTAKSRLPVAARADRSRPSVGIVPGKVEAAACWRPRLPVDPRCPSGTSADAYLRASAVRSRTGLAGAWSPPMKPPPSAAADRPHAFDPCGTHRDLRCLVPLHGDFVSDIDQKNRYRLRNLSRFAYHRKMPSKMHQTTVRFGADLWDALEREGERLGVSVAQYLREAALARLVYSSGRRGDDEFDLALEIALGETGEPARIPQPDGSLRPSARVLSPMERADVETSESSALWAQARQARLRAEQLREVSAGQLRHRGRASRRAAPDGR